MESTHFLFFEGTPILSIIDGKAGSSLWVWHFGDDV